jgi:hypothetical protein
VSLALGESPWLVVVLSELWTHIGFASCKPLATALGVYPTQNLCW